MKGGLWRGGVWAVCIALGMLGWISGSARAASVIVATPEAVNLQGRPGQTVTATITATGDIGGVYAAQTDLGTVGVNNDQISFSFTIPDPPPQAQFTGTIVIFGLESQESVTVPVTVQVIGDPVVLDVPSGLSGLPGDTVSGPVTVIQGDAPFSLTVSAGELSRTSGVGLQEPVTFTYTIPTTATPGQPIEITVTAVSALDQVGEAVITIEVLQAPRPVVIEVPGRLGGMPGETVSGTIRVLDGNAPFSLSVDRGELSKVAGVGLDEPVTYRFSIPTTAQPGARFPVTVTVTSSLGESDTAGFDIVVNQSISALLGALAQTPPQREMGRVIGVVCPKQVAGENLQRDCDALVGAAGDQDPSAAQALARVTPDQVSAPTDASQTAMRTQLRNLGARLAALRAGARGVSLAGLSFSLNGQPIQLAALASGWLNAAEAEGGSPLGTLAGGRLGVFINGDVRFGNRDRTDLVEGFDFNTYGITLGADYRFLETFVAGVSVGYTNNRLDIDGGRGKLDSDGWSGSLYATWYQDFDAHNGIYVDGLLSYGTLGYDQVRAVSYRFQTGTQVDQGLNGDFDSAQWAFSLGGGYRWQRGALSVGPVVRLDYVSASIDGYDETARDPSAPGSGWRVHIDDQDIESLTTKLGLDLSYAMSQSWGVVVPQLKLDWVHEFKLDADPVTGYFVEDPTREAFRLEVDRPDRDYFNLGIGAVMQLPHGLSGHVFYRKLLGYDTLSMDSISFGLRMEF